MSLAVKLYNIYQPISLDITIGGSKAISSFAKGSNIPFIATSKARYQIPRVTFSSDTVLVSIQDPLGSTKIYRQVMTKSGNSFLYNYQSSLSATAGPWRVSFYTVLNDNKYLTPLLIGFILE